MAINRSAQKAENSQSLQLTSDIWGAVKMLLCLVAFHNRLRSARCCLKIQWWRNSLFMALDGSSLSSQKSTIWLLSSLNPFPYIFSSFKIHYFPPLCTYDRKRHFPCHLPIRIMHTLQMFSCTRYGRSISSHLINHPDNVRWRLQILKLFPSCYNLLLRPRYSLCCQGSRNVWFSFCILHCVGIVSIRDHLANNPFIAVIRTSLPLKRWIGAWKQ
jgi:hypothetical protein